MVFIWSGKSGLLIVNIASNQVWTCHRASNRTKRMGVKERKDTEFQQRVADKIERQITLMARIKIMQNKIAAMSALFSLSVPSV